jgi:N6-adenosine-specific RNA methylase IME4
MTDVTTDILVTTIGLGGIAPLPNRLRKLKQELVTTLAESMAVTGLLQPIIVRRRIPSGYWLIAGWHRLEAARKLKWDGIDCRVIEIDNDDEARLYEIDENLARGELSPAERAIHIAARQPLYEKLHPETKHGGAPGAGKGQGKRVRKDAETASFVKDTATKTNRKPRTVAKDTTRARRIPRITETIGTPLDKADELDALAKLPQDQQDDLIDRAVAGETISAKNEAKRHARAQREQELAASQTAGFGDKRYGVLYADPPWRWEPRSRDTGMDRAADNHYPTMTTERIMDIEVPVADDAVLFLWATVPMLLEAFDVMAAWGFVYKSHFVWVKPKAGTGYWNRNKHELLLVGTRGSVPAPAPGDQDESVITAPAGKHSAKPFCVREMIEEMFPTLPRIELFARGERVVGWDQWGNEIGEAAQ